MVRRHNPHGKTHLPWLRCPQAVLVPVRRRAPKHRATPLRRRRPAAGLGETWISPSLPSLWCLTRRYENSLPLAAWIVQARGGIRNIARRTAAGLFDGADRI